MVDRISINFNFWGMKTTFGIQRNNFLLLNQNKFCKVIEVKEKSLKVEYDGEDGKRISNIEIERFSGIPITEEILVKVGFELFPWGWVYKTSSFGFRLNLKTFSYNLGNERVKPEFVHRLQNLFSDLSNEDLNIEL